MLRFEVFWYQATLVELRTPWFDLKFSGTKLLCYLEVRYALALPPWAHDYPQVRIHLVKASAFARGWSTITPPREMFTSALDTKISPSVYVRCQASRINDVDPYMPGLQILLTDRLGQSFLPFPTVSAR